MKKQNNQKTNLKVHFVEGSDLHSSIGGDKNEKENSNKTYSTTSRLNWEIESNRLRITKRNRSMLMVDGQLKRFCDQCAACGRRSRLKLYQINFEEAYYMCENVECSYPLEIEERFSESLIKRDSSSITTPAQRRAQAAAALVETPSPLCRQTSISKSASVPSSVKSLRTIRNTSLPLSVTQNNSITQAQTVPQINDNFVTVRQRNGKTQPEKNLGSLRLSPTQFAPSVLAKFKSVDSKFSRSAGKSNSSVGKHKNSDRKPQISTQIDQKYLDKFSGLLDGNLLLSKPTETKKRAKPSPVTTLCDLLPEELIDVDVKSDNPRPSNKRKSCSSTPTNSIVSKKQCIGNLFLQEATKIIPSSLGKRRTSSLPGEFRGQFSAVGNPDNKVKPPELVKKLLKEARERPGKTVSVLGANKFAPFVLDSTSLPKKEAKDKRNVFAALGNSNAGVKKVSFESKSFDSSSKSKRVTDILAPEQTTRVNKIANKPTSHNSLKAKHQPVKETVDSSTSFEDAYCDSFDTSLFDDVKTKETAPKHWQKSAEELVFEEILDSVNRSTLKLKQTFTSDLEDSVDATEYKVSQSNNFRKAKPQSWDQTSDGCSVNSSVSSSPKLSPFHVKTSCESVVNIDSLLLDTHRESDIDQELLCIFSGPKERDVCSTSVNNLN